MIKKILKSDWFAVFFFLLSALLIVFFWFKNGNYIAGGEANLSTWNASKALNVYRFSWIDFGLGYPSPFWLPRIPTYIFTYLLSIFFNPIVVQAVVFWALLSTGGIGMYLLANFFLGSKKKWIPLLAGIFYVLNLYTQSQVWARFIFAGFFTWASFPLLLFLWIKWLEEAKFKFLFLFALSSVIFSSAYSHPAFILGFWSIAVLFSTLKVCSKELKFQAKKVYLFRIILGFFAWALVNIWWIYPYIKLQSSVVSNIHDWKYDLASLGGVSVDSKISDVLLLRHKFFFERLDYWGDFYKPGLSYLISLMILVISFFGFIKAKALKEYKYLVILAVIGLFICKGTNPPFGTALFRFLFEYIPLARVFRSSYEKFGTIWLMVYSIFFANGFGLIYQKLSNIWKVAWVGILIPLFLVVLVWPMWKNGPFSPLARVFVPEYYNTADKYLNSLESGGRILSLPIIPGEGVKYNWGVSSYYGLEPSDMLFSESAVSKTVRYSYADDKYMEMYDLFVQGKNIDELLSETNVEYLILHNELDPKYSNASTSAEVKKTLSKHSSIKFLKSFGKLDIYKNINFIPNKMVEIRESVLYSYHRINSGHYRVEVADARKPFELILKNSFSPLWEAKIDDEIQEHDVAYGYANGWAINQTGSYTIDLVFKVWPEFLSGTN